MKFAKIAQYLILGYIAACSVCGARQLFALEKFPVKSLKIFDTVWSEKRGVYYAFVLDPDGYVHHVEIKEHLGKIGEGGGLISNITRCAIYYDALISDGNGGWNVVPSVLEIKPNSDLFESKHCQQIPRKG